MGAHRKAGSHGHFPKQIAAFVGQLLIQHESRSSVNTVADAAGRLDLEDCTGELALLFIYGVPLVVEPAVPPSFGFVIGSIKFWLEFELCGKQRL